jgi:hypothetical protein
MTLNESYDFEEVIDILANPKVSAAILLFVAITIRTKVNLKTNQRNIYEEVEKC